MSIVLSVFEIPELLSEIYNQISDYKSIINFSCVNKQFNKRAHDDCKKLSIMYECSELSSPRIFFDNIHNYPRSELSKLNIYYDNGYYLATSQEYERMLTDSNT